MQIVINPQALRAVAHFRGIKDIRPYLNGVHIEADHEHTIIVATNGHVAAAYQDHVANDVPCPVQFRIPAEVVALLVKGKSSMALLSLEKDELTSTHWGVLTPQGRLEFAPDHDRYPDWRRVFPAETNGQPIIMPPDVVAPIWKAAAEFGIKGIGQKGKPTLNVGLNGTAGASLASIDAIPGLAMCFMGMKDVRENPYVSRRPTWLSDTFTPKSKSVMSAEELAEDLV